MGSLPRKAKVVLSDPQWEMYGVRIDEDAIPAVYDGFRTVYDGKLFKIVDPSDEEIGSSTSAQGASSIIRNGLQEWLMDSCIESTLSYSDEWARWKLKKAVIEFHEEYLKNNSKFGEDVLSGFKAVQVPIRLETKSRSVTGFEIVSPVYDTKQLYFRNVAETMLEKMARGWLDFPPQELLDFDIQQWAKDLVGKARLVTSKEHLEGDVTSPIGANRLPIRARNIDLSNTGW